VDFSLLTSPRHAVRVCLCSYVMTPSWELVLEKVNL